MRDRWTVEYRNWPGAPRRGLLFMRARQGRGRWRKANELPPHVAQYLHLDRLGRRWVLSGVRESDLKEGSRVTFAARTPGRIYCDIREPPKVVKEKSYAPLTVARYLPNYDSPWQLYRAKYKYTDCGPTLGIKVTGKDRPIYCDSLPGTWEGLPGRVLSFLVSSIVEGVDTETDTIEVPVAPLVTLDNRLDEAVSEVNRQATEIWNDTHGCPKCGPENELGYHTINPKCRACHGEGVIL